MVVVVAFVLAGCATQPVLTAGGPGEGRYFDPILGVWASPRVVDDGQPVPRGGGGYLVGRPYTIGGRTFIPNANPQGYSVVGTASWYGDAFHGRRTANGEIFDKRSISAAHPTLPLPSYVRVTNLKNSHSMIVRVNDRGPYHGGRVMDVSQRVAEALDFKGEGTAQIRVEYIGRASLAGSDDSKLTASLRTDGGPAQLGGVAVADQADDTAPPSVPAAPAQPLPRQAIVPVARTGRFRGLALPINPRQDPWTSLRSSAVSPARPQDSRFTALPAPPVRSASQTARRPTATAPLRPLFASPAPSDPVAEIGFAVPRRRPALVQDHAAASDDAR
jgi:rare lipoprotein A